MNEQEQENVFQSIMDGSVQNSYSSHSTNAAAETIVNVVAILVLIAGIFCGMALIGNGVDLNNSFRGNGGTVLIIAGVIVIIISIIQWAFMKIVINISRNLFNINEFLRARFSDKEN